MTHGADGVFLIGHAMKYGPLCEIYEHVRKQFPEIWIGINFLDITGYDTWHLLGSVVRHQRGINGLWVDMLPDERIDVPSSVEVFGGVAFKYIDPNIRGQELKEACNKALKVVDVVTTSGIKTGSAPDTEKLEEIRRNIGNETQLALASGVTEENVSLFLPTVDTFLVASSIIERKKSLGNHEYLIPEKVASLAQKIHA
jgi:predicted TIM-barrel enzyme